MCDGNEKYHKSTPPKPGSKVKNPFDRVLIGKLHMPICSPGMCKIYKKQVNGSFKWEIDQACALVPADIVACSSQFEPTPDPALEKIAEEATEKFFSQEMIPSPIESSKNVRSLQISHNSSIHIDDNDMTRNISAKDVSTQTLLTLPPILPPEIENILKTYCTFTQEQDLSGEYEITANGSLRRKLFFEEHSDIDHYDSEQTDDELPSTDKIPSSNFVHHSPVNFSPDLSHNISTKEMKRTFGTPLSKAHASKLGYRNKILESVDIGEPCFSPIFQTPHRIEQGSGASSSLASVSISPVAKISSSDEEKNNFSSPDSAMATCLDCNAKEGTNTDIRICFCKTTPNKSLLKRSASLKESPRRSKKRSNSISGKRSSSMSNLHRNRSVQKLDFSLDMSIDDSIYNGHTQDLRCHSALAGSDSSSSPNKGLLSWSIADGVSGHQHTKTETPKRKNDNYMFCTNMSMNESDTYDGTPIKIKSTTNARTHEINKIRAPQILSPMNMSLDESMECNSDNPLCLEDKKMDFNNVDLNFLTTHVSHLNYTTNTTKISDSTTFKRIDSGFTENTFYTNASSYYESAIKPSELVVTDVSNSNNAKGVLKEISNVNWMRVDSGFKDENSADSDHFYGESSVKKLVEKKLENKENLATGGFDRFFVQASNKNEAMSISDIFADDMAFNCNFSSTPSKNKPCNNL